MLALERRREYTLHLFQLLTAVDRVGVKHDLSRASNTSVGFGDLGVSTIFVHVKAIRLLPLKEAH